MNLPWRKMAGLGLLLLCGSCLQMEGGVGSGFLDRIWQFEDGLPQNAVQAVIQAREGYIWVGTQNGLARFDGVNFRVFDPSNTPEMKSSMFTCFCETKDGSLWMGTEGGGLLRLKDGKFSSFSKVEGLSGNIVRALHETRDGVLWVGTTEGVSLFEKERFTFFSAPGWPTNSVVRAFAEDREGNLWLGANTAGLFSYKNGQVTTNNQYTPKTGSAVRALCMDRHKSLWFGTTEGLHRLSKKGNLRNYDRKDGLPGIVITAYEDRRGNLWIGTYGGLCRIVDGKIVRQMNSSGLAFDAVYSICEDREGNLWVGTKEGLNRLKARAFEAYTQREGLGDNNIMSILERKNGDLLVATWGGGLSQIVDGQVVRSLGCENYGFRNDLALGLCEGRDGDLWIGFDFEAGLCQLKKNGQTNFFWKPHGLRDSAVKVIHEDRNGDLWIGTRTALYIFRNGKFSRLTKADGLAGDMVRAILEDADGNLWFGSNGGLSLRQDGKFINFTMSNGLSTNNIAALYEDKAGTIWIGTVGGGLNRMRRQETGDRRQEPSFTSYRMEQGMFRNDVFEILEDDLGNFWMTCRFGIYRVPKKQFDALDAGKIKTLTCTSYGKHEGLISLECNAVAKPAACKTQDGRLWFATSKGLVTVDPKVNCEINQEIPPVFIEEIRADRKKIEHRGGGIALSKNVKSSSTSAEVESAPVHIPAGRGEIEFQFTTLSYSVPEGNRCKYMLEGFDTNWIDAGTRRMAQYSNLRPGNYKFRVIGSNNDGVWNETGASFAFQIAPHFYQTGWFYAGGGLIFIGCVFGIHRMRVRQLKGRQQELLATVEERTKHLKAEIAERQKAQAEIETVHRQLLDTSRRAGMAEVASGVLHNVGNVLNSVNVSATCAMDQVRNSRQAGLSKVVTLLQENNSDLGSLFTRDEKGKQLPVYMAKLSEHLNKEQTSVLKELESVCKNIDHIKDIVALQQNYARVSGLIEPLNVQELVEDALRMNAAALARHDVKVTRNFAPVPPVATDKHKVLQILVNLIRNAKYACDEADQREKRLTVGIRMTGENRVRLIVSDNGIGIPKENLTRIFSHGFTTRKDGHGFGLHSSALTAREMGGSLTVDSAGRGQGATFTLELPLKPEQPKR